MAYNNNMQRNTQRGNDRVRYDLLERIGILSTNKNGWTKEVNLMAWNGGVGKIDIREWDPDHRRMGKGITLFEEEAEWLAKALAARYGIGLGLNTAADMVREPAPGEENATEPYAGVSSDESSGSDMAAGCDPQSAEDGDDTSSASEMA